MDDDSAQMDGDNTIVVVTADMQKAITMPKMATKDNFFAKKLVLFNPILTGLFESKFLLGGGVNLTPPSDLGPEGADRREILHGCQDTCKEYCYNLFLAENCFFIMLLWFMQIRCIIITYLLIFPTNRISEGQFWQKVM